MNQKYTSHQHGLPGWVLLALSPFLLWWVSHPSRTVVIELQQFLFWHTAVEVFAVVVAMLIFVTGYRAILSPRKGAMVILGVAFLGVGLLDFLHAMAYAGMPHVMTPNTPQKSIFFWLAARGLAAGALLVYALLPATSHVTLFKKHLALGIMLVIVAMLGCIGNLWPDKIPLFFSQEQGLTPLKVGLEWLIIFTHLATLLALWYRRHVLAHECIKALALAVMLSAISELFFTMLGVFEKDGANVLGHLYKVAAYLYLFHATVSESLNRPLQHMEMQHLREKLILNAAPDGVMWVDHTGRILMANPAMETLTGYPASKLITLNVDILSPPAQHGDSALLRDYFLSPGHAGMAKMEVQLVRSDGQLLPVDISLGDFEEDGTRHVIAYIRDITDRKEYEASLRYLATHDELTGLPNRSLFCSQLHPALASARRSGQRVAVMFLDLDYFKTVNDSLGHTTGDALLVKVGTRIRNILGAKDTLARFGGDEFAIFLPDLDSREEAQDIAARLLMQIQESYRLQEQDVYSGASLGLSFYPDDAQDIDTLLRYADMAMYHAKQAGRGNFVSYSQDMDRCVHEDLQLHTRLKEALDQDLLELHYQPQVDVKTGKIVGAEALLRWHDPVLGNVSPARFIPIAEATGLIVPLSEWVLRHACRQIAAWTAAGTPLCVAVNFSTHQFRQRNLHEKVAATLALTHADAQYLCIEITESVAMQHPEQARVQLNALVALGCSVALDDFGTGYSSLAYLKTLPVSKLKIDKSFLDGIPHDPNDVTISRAIIALAHSLGLTLVAEGVETNAQLDFLRQYDCEAYQGWLFAKAMRPQELSTKLLAIEPAPRQA